MGSFLSSVAGGDASAAEVDHGNVASFHSEERWQLHLNSIKDTNKLLVIDFTASWCGPCKFMAPIFSDMANRFTEVSFAKIDVDELPGVSREFDVQAMPTFVLMKRGKIIDRIVGGKKDELERKIVQHKAIQPMCHELADRFT